MYLVPWELQYSHGPNWCRHPPSAVWHQNRRPLNVSQRANPVCLALQRLGFDPMTLKNEALSKGVEFGRNQRLSCCTKRVLLAGSGRFMPEVCIPMLEVILGIYWGNTV